MLDNFGVDLLIQITSFLNVVDSSHFSKSSRRLCYLVHQLRTLNGPQLVASAASKDIIKDCLEKLTSPPNLALSFHDASEENLQRLNQMELPRELKTKLPPNAVCLGVISEGGIQANIGDVVTCTSHEALMLGSFLPDRTHIQPFCLDMMSITRFTSEDMYRDIQEELGPIHTYKVIFLYACGRLGSRLVEYCLPRLQALYPEAVIVGGICTAGYVCVADTRNTQPPTMVANGVFGVAFAGDVPMRSVVSRGVRSLLTEPDEASPWCVHETALLRPQDEGYMFEGPADVLKPYHQIKFLRNTETGKNVDFLELFQYGTPHLFGLKRRNEDGYELHPMNSFLHTGNLIIMTDGLSEQEESYKDASFDMYTLDGQAHINHMELTMAKLREQTQREAIVGALMVSCCARGPEPFSFLPERMSDARKFHSQFPDVPCLGFYAMGEIGPMALAGNSVVFQRGRAAMQGFTVVFALFILPVVEPGSFQIDDSAKNVAAFVRGKLDG